MTKVTGFAPEQIHEYRERGFLKVEIAVFSPAEVAKLESLARPLIEAHSNEKKEAHIHGLLRLEPQFLDFLISDKVLDKVESLLGPSFGLSSSNAFVKLRNTDSQYNWHTDVDAVLLDDEINKVDVTALLIALTPSTELSGCVKYVVGSHLSLEKRDYNLPENPTSSYIAYGLDLTKIDTTKGIVSVELRPGEISFHNIHTVHGSEPNRADFDRILLNFWFFKTDVPGLAESTYRKIRSAPGSRILLRGEDPFQLCRHSLVGG